MASPKEIKGSLHDEDGTWVVRARVFYSSMGKTKQKSKSTGLKVKDKTKRKAEQMMKEIIEGWEQEANQSPIIERPKEIPQFSEYVNEWLDNKDVSVRANTAKSYRDYAKAHILPELGGYPVNEITWRILQKFCDRKLANHSQSPVKKFFIVIRGALDDAVRDDAIRANPESLVKWPKAERTQKARALAPDEIARLLDAAERAGEPMRAATTLALFYGLRQSEACGLRWTDIDFKKNTMHIQHTVIQNGTTLANAGVPPKQLQAFLDHDDIEMTLGVYVHASESAAAETSNRMGEAMSQILFAANCSDFCSESPKVAKLG